MDERFTYDTYLVRRKILSLVGASFHFYDPMGNVVLFARMKAFKLPFSTVESLRKTDTTYKHWACRFFL
ncbi:MAG: hypothetical protein BWY74_01011 [Firmicutes bacterium ADurb.Bin419]|nr:MAG: hypothetical protein BWY74_01011 [Firmicutes bacterium ADurb.Bin419]